MRRILLVPFCKNFVQLFQGYHRYDSTLFCLPDNQYQFISSWSGRGAPPVSTLHVTLTRAKDLDPLLTLEASQQRRQIRPEGHRPKRGRRAERTLSR